MEGARRVSPEFTAGLAGKNPEQVLEEYNKAQKFGKTDRGDEAEIMIPKDLIGVDPDAIAGLLYAREAQLTKAYGPEARGGLRPREEHLGDPDIMYQITEPYRVTAGPKGDRTLASGIGPHTMTRAVTTERLMDRILRGEDPYSIADDLVRAMGSNTKGLKGRYANGGLVQQR